MVKNSQPDFTYQLQQLMQRVGISSNKALSRASGVGELDLIRLRRGGISRMRVDSLLKLASTLQVSVSELLETFGAGKQTEQTDATLRQEYQRLQTQLEQQRETLSEEFRQSSLQVLESWMLQWPTAAYAAQQNPSAPAVKLLPLVRPVENLLQQWGVENFAPVGSEVPYDPQFHQLMEGSAEPGETVKVRYSGYRIGSRLLFRAKVSPLTQPQSI